MTTEPGWLAPYVERKAAQLMTALKADATAEWIGPGATIQGAVEALVREVVGEMALHLTAPHSGPGEEPVREAREKWAAGS